MSPKIHKEHSYGILPFKKEGTIWRVLLIQHQNGGHWGFPKGHSEQGEAPQEAAERELLEETGLMVEQYLFHESFSETYRFTRDSRIVDKSVTYFPALVTGTLALQHQELVQACWLPLDEVSACLTFPEGKALFTSVLAALFPEKKN